MFTPYDFIKNQKVSLSLHDLVLSPVNMITNNNKDDDDDDDDGNNNNVESNHNDFDIPMDEEIYMDNIRSEGIYELDNYKLELENLLRKSNNTIYEETLRRFVEEKYNNLNQQRVSISNLNESKYDFLLQKEYDQKKRINEMSKPLPHKLWKPTNSPPSPYQSTNHLGRQRPPSDATSIAANTNSKSPFTRKYKDGSSSSSPLGSRHSPNNLNTKTETNLRYFVQERDRNIYDGSLLLHSPDLNKIVTIDSFNKWLEARKGKAYSLHNSPNTNIIKTLTLNNDGIDTSRKHSTSPFKLKHEEYFLVDVFERLSQDRKKIVSENTTHTARSASPSISERSRHLAERYRRHHRTAATAAATTTISSSPTSLSGTTKICSDYYQHYDLPTKSHQHQHHHHYNSNQKMETEVSKTNGFTADTSYFLKGKGISKITSNSEKLQQTALDENIGIDNSLVGTTLQLKELVLLDIANAKAKAQSKLKSSSSPSSNIKRNLKSIENMYVRKELARRYSSPGPNHYNNCRPKDAERVLSSPPIRSNSNLTRSRSPSPGIGGYTFSKESSNRLDQIVRRDLL